MCMVIVKDKLNRCVEENGMHGEVQGGFYKRTKSLLIRERIMERARMRKECTSVAFIDMEKAYDRVKRDVERSWSP